MRNAGVAVTLTRSKAVRIGKKYSELSTHEEGSLEGSNERVLKGRGIDHITVTDSLDAEENGYDRIAQAKGVLVGVAPNVLHDKALGFTYKAIFLFAWDGGLSGNRGFSYRKIRILQILEHSLEENTGSYLCIQFSK